MVVCMEIRIFVITIYAIDIERIKIKLEKKFSIKPLQFFFFFVLFEYGEFLKVPFNLFSSYYSIYFFHFE